MILTILIIAGHFSSCKKYETKKYRGKYFFITKHTVYREGVEDTTTFYYGSISDGPDGKLIVDYSPVFIFDNFYKYTLGGFIFLNVDADGEPTNSIYLKWSTIVSFSDDGDVEINDGGGPNGVQFSAEIHGKRL
ncbi:MAG: hypothetical protein NTX61_18840 [Bacteroidetes bacterium]|nr:hypothetical protein [Bacteroidota bacterium]